MTKRSAPPTAWKPGQSGNLGGAKREKLMRDALIIALKRESEKGSKTKRLQSVAEALVEKACEGDVAAAKEIFDRVDGKVPQSHDIKKETTVTVYAEAISAFDRWVEGAASRSANGADENVGDERSVLPDTLPPESTRH